MITKDDKLENYQMIIENMELLTRKMEEITREYFEANVDFISKVSGMDLQNKLVTEGGLSLYGKRFNDLLGELESDTRLLKREKINLQFSKDLIIENGTRLR